MTVQWQIFWVVLAVIFAVYGILIWNVGSGTGFFLVWIMMSIASLLCAAAVRFHLLEKLPFSVKLAAGIACLLVCILFIVVEIQIVSAFHAEPEKDLDYLIVPGAQIHEKGPSVVLRYRLDKACEYLEKNPGTDCIVSGGQGYNEPYPEAVGMKNYLMEQGIDEYRILIEKQAVNTRENMELSQSLFDPENDRVGVVTNNFHIYRSCALARQSGIRHVCGVPAYSRPLYLPNNLLREFFGVVKDRAKGNI